MKIIKATWENRNLGCDAYEITLDRKDLKNFDAVLDEIHTQDFAGAYVTLKMPVGDLKALHALEDDGFRFMETQFHIADYFEPKETPDEAADLMKNAERIVIPKDRAEWERIISKITPDMFDTDRISLDPLLGKEMACKRYQNWCRDLFDNPNSWMWVMKVDGQEVSFGLNVRDAEKQTDDGILGGVFAKFKNIGYGIFQSGELNRKTKGKTIVSSNNTAMLRIYQHFGKIITKEMYVLRKIYEERK